MRLGQGNRFFPPGRPHGPDAVHAVPARLAAMAEDLVLPVHRALTPPAERPPGIRPGAPSRPVQAGVVLAGRQP